jgi:AcrR family transcriptional regulator
VQVPRKKQTILCKRPYSLGRRQELSDRKRAKILSVARAQLESNGFLAFTLDSLARESGLTRQTIHNLFRTKAGLLEALFDQLAMAGGMERMREVMQQSDPEFMLSSFVKVFTGFWAKDRLLIRRIHGIAAIDPEFGAAVEARNQRRRGAAARVAEQMDRHIGPTTQEARHLRSITLYALTSFEFFDIVAEGCSSSDQAAALVLAAATKIFFPTRL